MATGNFTSRAIAYLKPNLSAGKPTGRRVVELSGPDAPVLRDLNNGLLVAYVVDTGEQFEWVQHRHLAAEGCDEDELHAVGLTNLVQLAAGSLEVAPHPCGELFAVLMGGNFEASLILLDVLWEESFRPFVSGQYVVAIPARDILGFCDASSAAGLHELRAVCETARTENFDHPISNQLYTRVGDGWQVFEG